MARGCLEHRPDPLNVFDLTLHKVTQLLNSGLPTTSGVAFTLSQDGNRAYMSNGAGNSAIMDTNFGNTLATENVGSFSLSFRWAADRAVNIGTDLVGRIERRGAVVALRNFELFDVLQIRSDSGRPVIPAKIVTLRASQII